MKPSAYLRLLFLTFASTAISRAQSTPATAPTASPLKDDIVTLSPFEVSVSKASRYQSDESAGGGRIRANIMETPSSVTVLTREFMEDIAALRVLDAAKYVAGISEASLNNGLDRVNIRGFQSDGRRVDGFSTSDQANYDTAGIERMEVTKGPDALLQPSGVPGGTINLITKSPKFDPSGYVTVQAGQYDSNRIEADYTAPLGAGGKFAYRMVAAVHDSDGYTRNAFRKSTYLLPSFTWRVAPNSQLTVHYEYYKFKTNNIEGLPIDPSVGPNDRVRPVPGVSPKFNATLGSDFAFRRVESHSGTFLLTSAISDRLSIRLAGRLAEVETPDSGFSVGTNTQGGGVDPQTGFFVPGVIFAANGTTSPAPALNRQTLTHSGTNQGQILRLRDFQNDWVYKLSAAGVDSSTMAGYAYSYTHQNLQANAQRAASFSLDNFVPDTAAPVQSPLNTDRRSVVARSQFYAAETLSLFAGRVVLSGGVTNVQFTGSFVNKLADNGQIFPGDGSASTYNYGLVVKPLKTVSLYYGHTENAVPNSRFDQVVKGSAPAVAEGEQDEVGLKVQLLRNKLFFSVAYFDINQTGFNIPNPGNLTSPPPPVLLPPLSVSRTTDGWEFQATAALSKQLSLIGSYTNMDNRDPRGVLFRGAAEKLAAGFVRYAFTSGPLEGLAIGFGLNYQSKRAGDQTSGFTSASTSTNLIPVQPSFFLPARTLADANLTYNWRNLDFRLAANNLFDKRDFATSGNRNSLLIGNPLNLSGSVTYRF